MYPSPYRPGVWEMLKGIKWGGILDGTQKTLGVINQAIPIVYQVKPMVNNMRSVFKIANMINEPTPPTSTPVIPKIQENKPVFYL
ncbi:MAG: hypothetical protein IJ193_08585 [Bacilli bacterium]|nr:hypothetical protein [Bacilli bacterium]